MSKPDQEAPLSPVLEAGLKVGAVGGLLLVGPNASPDARRIAAVLGGLLGGLLAAMAEQSAIESLNTTLKEIENGDKKDPT